MKYFSETEVHQSIPINLLIEKIEDFYLHQTDVNIPERFHLHDGENTVLIMPAFDLDYYAIKLVGVAPQNKQLNKPSIYGTVILHNRKTLEPLAIFDGKAITSIRTGAIGGLSIKYLSKETAENIGIVGTGVQGWSHLLAAIAVRNIKKVYLYNRSSEKSESFKRRVKTKYPHLKVVTTNIHNLIISSDIIVTTTTSYTPVLPDIHPNVWREKLIVAVGSFKPTMQELPDSLLKQTSSFYVDTKTALTESGDMLKAQELHEKNLHISTLKDIIQKQIKPSSITIFKSVGMALFDLLTAKFIFENQK